jgi:hypothetical protein
MRDHLKGIADEAIGILGRTDARVLDIGCNDGTLLRNYPSTFIKFGIDPSDVAQEIKGDITVVQDTSLPSSSTRLPRDANSTSSPRSPSSTTWRTPWRS